MYVTDNISTAQWINYDINVGSVSDVFVPWIINCAFLKRKMGEAAAAL